MIESEVWSILHEKWGLTTEVIGVESATKAGGGCLELDQVENMPRSGGDLH